MALGKQLGDKAFVRFRQQFGARSFTECRRPVHTQLEAESWMLEAARSRCEV